MAKNKKAPAKKQVAKKEATKKVEKKKVEHETARAGDEMLKVRRRDAADPKGVSRTPMKMNLIKKRKRVPAKNESIGNAGTLVLPTDATGLTVELRAAMLKIASRIGQDPKNIKLLEDTLEVMTAHVKARFEENKDAGLRVFKKRSDRIAEMKAKGNK